MEAKIVGPGFRQKVYNVVRQIPVGKVMAYSDVAAYLGSPRVARHVGWALAALDTAEKNAQYNGNNVPWHRVVNASGKISGKDNLFRYELQKTKLIEEGVVFGAGEKIDLDQYAWTPTSQTYVN